MASDTLEVLAARLRDALVSHDLGRFGALLADDARWGDDEAAHPCRSREEVVATFRRAIDSGASGEVVGVRTGPGGILLELRVRWPPGAGRPDRDVFHLCRVREGRISEIEPFAERAAAQAALAAR
ncbi:MAG TPA: nuclear transport factor 2 family protein [Acidimicrobiales bacterium]|nr:nuclear transport factor 2 family protein [Acidimicrobiales bacterium]